MSRGLADTSVFIARESGRSLDIDALPDELAVSIITIGELRDPGGSPWIPDGWFVRSVVLLSRFFQARMIAVVLTRFWTSTIETSSTSFRHAIDRTVTKP